MSCYKALRFAIIKLQRMAVAIHIRRICATAGLVVALAAVCCPAGFAAVPKRVMLLHSFGQDFKPWSEYAIAMRAELRRQSPWPLDIIEYSLVTARFSDEDPEAPFVDYLSAVFAKHPLDLIVSIGAPAAGFVQRHRQQLFATTPMMLMAVDERRVQYSTLTAYDAVVPVRIHYLSALENILHVLPDTKNVIVVIGTSPIEKFWKEAIGKEAEPLANRIKLSWTDELSFEALLKQARALPPHTAIFWELMIVDAAGVVHEGDTPLKRLHAVANAPIFSYDESFFGSGIVGGPLLLVADSSRQAAAVAVRILGGEKPNEIRTTPVQFASPVFDWRETQRWGISSSSLPQGATIRFRPLSFWDQYKFYAIGAIAVITLQLLMIGGLIAQSSRRRRVEAQLRESESRFRTMADAAPVMIWTSGLDKASTWCNQRLLDFVGHAGEQSTDFRWRQNIHPNDFDNAIRVYENSFDNRRSFAKEFRIKRHDGAYRWVLDCGIPLYGARNEFLGYIGSWIDITERREAELERQRHLEELAHVTRVRMIGEFTVSVAHELKQPLGAILSNAGAAELFLNADPPAIDEVRKALSDIGSDILRSTEIIQNMRHFLEKHEIVRKPIDVNYVVDEIVRLMSAEAAARKVGMAFEPDGDLPKVPGDRVHLQQVVMNLVLNSFEAMGGVSEDARRLRIQTGTNHNGTVIISVCDSGPGIPEDRLTKLFDPFFTTKKEGLGMGLSISRTIVEAHQGRLWAENNPGSGATFHIELPAHE